MNPRRIEIIGRKQTYALRGAVLRPNRPVEECMYPGDEHSSTLHLAVVVDEQQACIASFYAEAQREIAASAPYRLRGMATAPEKQSQGHGSALICHAAGLLMERGADVLWCNARLSAVAFYERLGFKCMGKIFDIPTIGLHDVMWKSLAT